MYYSSNVYKVHIKHVISRDFLSNATSWWVLPHCTQALLLNAPQTHHSCSQLCCACQICCCLRSSISRYPGVSFFSPFIYVSADMSPQSPHKMKRNSLPILSFLFLLIATPVSFSFCINSNCHHLTYL